MRLSHKMMAWAFILSSLLLNQHFAASQTYLVHTYTENDGLANSHVYDVAQDSTGRIWFATRGGVSVYDGANWKSYSISDGLPAVTYLKVRVDDRGIVWIVPEGPEPMLSYFSQNGWKSIPKIEGLTLYRTNSCEITFKNVRRYIAVGTKGEGVFVYANNQWKHITTSDGLPSNHIHGIAAWNGRFLVATENGLAIINGTVVDNRLIENIEIPEQNLLGIAIENKNETSFNKLKIWLVGDNWGGYLQNGYFNLVSDELKIYLDEHYHYLFILPDRQNGLYYGNPYHLYHYNSNTGKSKYLGTDNGLISEGVSGFLMDREKNIWIAGFRGVSKIASMRFANYNESQGLLEDEVSAILEYEPGKFLFGHNKGLTFFEDDNFRTLVFKKRGYIGGTEIRVLDLALDAQKNIWVAASHLGLAKMVNRKRLQWFGEKDGIILGSVTSVLLDNKGKLWVGGNKGLRLLKGEKFVPVSTDPLPEPHVRKIFKGSKNTLYLVTGDRGIYQLKHGVWKQYRSSVKKEINNVFYVLEDANGKIWVGTLAGLYTIQDDSLKIVKLLGRTLNRPIYLIIEDTRGWLWFGTDNGVIRWNGKNLRHFTVNDGFSGQETNRSAGIVDNNGCVWIGSNKGVSCYQAEHDYNSEIIPPPIVELLAIEASGEELNPREVNQISYNENNLIFHVRAISFVDEKTVRLRCMLQGFDKNWLYEYQSREHKIRYTNLSPGRYQFHVQARNALGVWSDIKSSEMIIIHEPFWQRWWFHLFSFLIFGLIILSVARYFSQKRYSYRLEKQVRERTAQLKESEQQYRTTIDSMADLIYVVDQNIRIVLFNTAFYEKNKELGLPTDVIGKSVFELFPFLPLNIRQEFRQVFDEGKMIITEENYEVNGTQIITETRKIPIVEKGKVTRVVTVIRDISERKHAEDALRESEEKYRRVVENANEAIVVIQDGKFKFFNPKAVEITGYSVDELTAMPFVDVVHPEDRQMMAERHVKRLKGEEFPHLYSFRIIDKAGNTKWLMINAVLVNWEGKPATLNFLGDITDLKEAERELRQRAEFERIITTISTEFINISPLELDEVINRALEKIGEFAHVDRSYIFLNNEANANMSNTHEWCAQGIEPQIEELQGLPIETFPWWMDKINRLENIYIPCVDDLPQEAKTEKELLKSQNIQSLVVVPLVYEGAAIGFLGFDSVKEKKIWSDEIIALLKLVGDVIANALMRKEAEEALQKSEERFRKIFEQSPIGMALINSEYRFVKVNKSLCKMFGYSENELKKISFTDLIHPEDVERSIKLAEEIFSGKLSHYKTEKRYIKKNKKVLWTSLTISVLRDETGKVIYTIPMIEDITERRQAEAKIKASLKEKEVLLKEIHHRVKNNLQVISSLLHLQSVHIKDKHALEMFRESQDRVRSMALVHEKLYRSADLAQIDFAEYIKSLVNGLYRAYKINPNKIEMYMDVSDIPITIDFAIPCGLIINELVSNALKHAFPPSWNKKAKIEIFLHYASNESIELILRDNGIGLPKDMDIRATDSLGLKLVTTLVESQLEGRVELERKRGTTFRMYFKKEMLRVFTSDSEAG